MEADGARTVEAELLDEKVLRLMVRDRDATSMSSWCRRHRYPKSAGFLRVNFVGELGFLQYAIINLSLRQPSKRQFQTSVTSTPDIIRAKLYHYLRPLSDLFSLRGTPLCRDTYTLPPGNISFVYV